MTKEEELVLYLDSLKEYGIPSADCMIYENHRQIFRHFTGVTDETKTRPIDGNERYLMFSMTKVQTMTAFLQLVEQGKVSPEDEVGKYLPAYRNLTVCQNGTTFPLKSPLKLKHLVSMQSGLDYNLERPGIVRVLKERGEAATTREFVDAFVESPLNFVPGECFCYSLSHDVVAAVIEEVSQMSFGTYLRKNIWEPLGMGETFFARPDNSAVERLAAQYICDEKGNITLMDKSCVYQFNNRYESGGAGLISCTADYMKLADALACGGVGMNGARILKEETVNFMKTNLLCENSRLFLAKTMGRIGYGYGCGVQILMEPEQIGSCAPTGVFGWDGAAGSCIIMDTASKRSLVHIMHVRSCGVAYSVIHPRLREFLFEL